jgi:hypothetical protein
VASVLTLNEVWYSFCWLEYGSIKLIEGIMAEERFLAIMDKLVSNARNRCFCNGFHYTFKQLLLDEPIPCCCYHSNCIRWSAVPSPIKPIEQRKLVRPFSCSNPKREARHVPCTPLTGFPTDTNHRAEFFRLQKNHQVSVDAATWIFEIHCQDRLSTMLGW